jgi:hypothetical protein
VTFWTVTPKSLTDLTGRICCRLGCGLADSDVFGGLNLGSGCTHRSIRQG